MDKNKQPTMPEADKRKQAEMRILMSNLIPPADKNDPFGSYTGKPIDGGVPVQDADDL